MNLYESINESLNKSKAEQLAELLKEKYDIEYLKEAIMIELKNNKQAYEATYNKRQPVHAGPYIALMSICRELLPNVDSKSVQKALDIYGVNFKNLLTDACEYVKEERNDEEPKTEGEEFGEIQKPSPEEEEFFEKNETLIWAEYAHRADVDLRDVGDDDVDYDLLLQIVHDLMKEKGVSEGEELDESRDEVAENLPKFIYDLGDDAWSAQEPRKTLGGKTFYNVERNGKATISNEELIAKVLERFPDLVVYPGFRSDGSKITFIKKAELNEKDLGNDTYSDPDEAEYYRNKQLYKQSNLARHRDAMEKAKKACEEKGIKLKEDTVEVNDPTPKRDYNIVDITVLEPVGDGDVRAIDVQELLARVDESLSEKYGENWGHINIVTSRKTLDESSATFELRLKESNYAMNFIVSGKNALKEFQVYTTMGKQIYNKKTMDVVPQMEAYVEQFLDVKALKENELDAKLDDKKVKNTIEEYVRVSGNRESAILLDSITREIKFFKDMKKDLGEENETIRLEREQLHSLIHRLVCLLPLNTAEEPEQFKKLNLGTIPDIEEVIFKDFMKDVDKEEKLKESYQVFNIGNMQVVYNSATQECVYSIDSKEVQDKRLDLTKIPSVEVPYDTDTIIKNYIEKQVGRIPQEGDEEKVGADKPAPVQEPQGEVKPEQTEQPVEDKVEKESLSEDDVDIDNVEGNEGGVEEVPDDDNQLEQPEQNETGSAIFIRKPQTLDQIKNEIEKGLEGNKSTYIVAKTLTLSPEEYKDLALDLTKPRDYFKDVDVVDGKNYAFNVIEITGGEDTLLIDNAGSDFAKYVAIK